MKYYKGERISELLKQIDKLSKALEDNHEEYENETQALRAIEAQTTLAIAKAKLTALQGEDDAN
jgi:signal transduction histidine kinase